MKIFWSKEDLDIHIRKVALKTLRQELAVSHAFSPSTMSLAVEKAVLDVSREKLKALLCNAFAHVTEMTYTDNQPDVSVWFLHKVVSQLQALQLENSK